MRRYLIHRDFHDELVIPPPEAGSPGDGTSAELRASWVNAYFTRGTMRRAPARKVGPIRRRPDAPQS